MDVLVEGLRALHRDGRFAARARRGDLQRAFGTLMSNWIAEALLEALLQGQSSGPAAPEALLESMSEALAKISSHRSMNSALCAPEHHQLHHCAHVL